MRITKRQLRRIIKEEKQQLLAEKLGVSQTYIERLYEAMAAIYDQTQYEQPSIADAKERAADIIMEEVWGFMESIDMQGYAGLP